MQAPPSDEWLGDLAILLKDDGLRRDVLAVVKKHGLRDFDRAILALTARADLPVELRIAAIDAIAIRLNLAPEMFALLLRELQTNSDPVARLLAGRALASVRLSDAQPKELAAVLSKLPASAGLLVLPAFARLRDTEVGLSVIKSLRGSPTAKRMTSADLDRLLASYSNDVLSESRGLRDDILRQVPVGEAESFAKLSRELPPGDAQRGQGIFMNSKAACTSCHRAAERGGGIGPNLSRVGFLRNSNELLESIVLPNASQLAEFRSWKVANDRGQSFTGLIVAETSDALYLREADRTVRRIERVGIEELEVSRVSIMPEGLEKLLTRQELADLIQFLAGLR
jgi:putative heme-binding domain-containing protein